MSTGSVGEKTPGGAFDFAFRRQIRVFERRRIRHRRIQGADDADGCVQELEGLLLDDRRDAFTDPAGPRVLVHDQHSTAAFNERQNRVPIEGHQRTEIENRRLMAVCGQTLGNTHRHVHVRAVRNDREVAPLAPQGGAADGDGIRRVV